MFKENLLKSGWVHAMFIAVVAYPLGAITARMVATVLESHILVYTVVFTISAAVALLLRSGPGPLAIKTLKRPETWLYSFLQIAVLIFGILIMKYVSATEGAGLYRVTGLFALILSFVFLSQHVNRYELVGSLLILFGFISIINYTEIPVEAKVMLVVFVIARALSQSSQQIIAETHKTNRQTKNTKDEARVAGFIMAVAGLLMLFVLLAIAYIKQDYEVELFKAFPNFSDFVDIKGFFMAIFMGLCIVSVSKYCEFYAGKTIGAKYLTSLLSLQIIFVYFIEKALSGSGIMQSTDFSMQDYMAMGLILAGNIVISLSGFIKDLKFIKKGTSQDTLENMDDKFIEEKDDFNILKTNLASVVSLFDGDISSVAKELKAEKIELENIINYEFENLKVETKLAKTINNFASLNVSLKDKLTKAHNRYYLEQKAYSLFEHGIKFRVYYLDLNKFKPINDSYGHETGDLVLVETVKRLQNLISENDLVVRLGGDEFIILQLSVSDDITNEIIRVIEEPIFLDGNKLEVSSSIGLADSTGYVNINQVLEDADKKMYDRK